jgi:uncharacterized repeat protein (TIGR03803 family)
MTRLRGWKSACAVSLFCAIAAIASPAQTFTTLLNFDGSNGAAPLVSLVQGLDGDFYGDTIGGGSGSGGTVFKVTGGGELTTLYNFCQQTGCIGGISPYGPIAQDSTGNFYTTTESGAVFKITPEGGLTVLFTYPFTNNLPFGVILAADGDLYGTTYEDGQYGLGTVYKMTTGGAQTTLYNFCATAPCPDGADPSGFLVQARDGNFYGTTTQGGINNGGTIFKMSPAGELSTLYSFCSQPNCSDGSYGFSLTQGRDGNLYGVAAQGGNPACTLGLAGCGTLFKITLAGAFTKLYTFCSRTNCSDGTDPMVLVQATDGNFYGLTQLGGNSKCGVDGCGTAFKMNRSGILTTLHTFNSKDGFEPRGLTQGTDGNFYGTTTGGGVGGAGTIFRLSLGLGPFVSLVRHSGKVGETGPILGQGFTGTTGVFLNGVPASFTVVSDSCIQATVPTGATTGLVTVETPNGTLGSNVPFYVIP